MSTVIRPEISKRGKYYIPKHRYYELKHFCLQYSYWTRAINTISSVGQVHFEQAFVQTYADTDPVISCVEAREYFRVRIDLVDEASRLSGAGLSNYILEGVTKGVGYNYLKTVCYIPCGKDLYYKQYRKFFWILDKLQIKRLR